MLSLSGGPGARVRVGQILIFSRINDLRRFWGDILPLLSAPDRRQTLHRIGYLNCWNPEQPGEFAAGWRCPRCRLQVVGTGEVGWLLARAHEDSL
jgi:hypothetical protein